MSGEIISALVAASAGFGVAYFTLRTQISQLKMQLGAAHRSEIIRRQLDALESVWSVFDAASRSGGNGRMLQNNNGNYAISVDDAQAFIRSLESTFNAKHGLYLSQKARRALFAFRDFIRAELINNATSGFQAITSDQFNAFYEKRKFVRLCLRSEVGSTDLRFSQEELRHYDGDDTSH